MGRTHANYDYPQVHPPQPQPKRQEQQRQIQQPKGTRYSWMEPAAAAEEKIVQSTSLSHTQPATIKVLPTLNEVVYHSSHIQQPQAVLQAGPFPQQQAQQTHVSKQQEAALYQQYNRPSLQAGYGSPTPPYYPQATSPALYTPSTPIQRLDMVKSLPTHPSYGNYRLPISQAVATSTPINRVASPNPPTPQTFTVPPTQPKSNINSYNPVPDPSTSGTWSSSLGSCTEPATCMTGLFCPCVLYGRVQHRLHLRSQRRDPTDLAGFSSINGSCVAWTLLCGINGILSGIQKSRVRRTYEMESGSGNVFSDCLVGCCCCCCVLAQNEKEIKHRGQESRKATTSEGYVPPTGMSFTPQT